MNEACGKMNDVKQSHMKINHVFKKITSEK